MCLTMLTTADVDASGGPAGTSVDVRQRGISPSPNRENHPGLAPAHERYCGACACYGLVPCTSSLTHASRGRGSRTSGLKRTRIRCTSSRNVCDKLAMSTSNLRTETALFATFNWPRRRMDGPTCLGTSTHRRAWFVLLSSTLALPRLMPSPRSTRSRISSFPGNVVVQSPSPKGLDAGSAPGPPEWSAIRCTIRFADH